MPRLFFSLFFLWADDLCIVSSIKRKDTCRVMAIYWQYGPLDGSGLYLLLNCQIRPHGSFLKTMEADWFKGQKYDFII